MSERDHKPVIYITGGFLSLLAFLGYNVADYRQHVSDILSQVQTNDGVLASEIVHIKESLKEHKKETAEKFKALGVMKP